VKANNAYDYTHTDQSTANADGTLDDLCDHYRWLGPYINPFGILNAGSSAVAGLVPVEFVSSTEPV
jgi:hypothetical protein